MYIQDMHIYIIQDTYTEYIYIYIIQDMCIHIYIYILPRLGCVRRRTAISNPGIQAIGS